MNHNHKKNNGIFNFKELKRNWETNSILCLIVVSAYMVGIFTGSMNWNEAYNGYYHPPATETPPYSTASIANETVETEITNVTGSDTDKTFEFTGRGIEQATKVKGFQCSINFGEFMGCKSPYTMFDLSGNDYTFEVRAVAQDGNVDHTPATEFWTVK